MADDGPDLSFIKSKGPDLSFIKPKPGAVEAETGVAGAHVVDPSAREEQGRAQEGSTWKPPLGMEQRRAELKGYPQWVGEGGVPIPTGESAQKAFQIGRDLSGESLAEEAGKAAVGETGGGPEQAITSSPLGARFREIGTAARMLRGILEGDHPADPRGSTPKPSEEQLTKGMPDTGAKPPPSINDNAHPGKIKDDFEAMLDEERTKVLKPANTDANVPKNPELSGGTDVTDFKKPQDLTQEKPKVAPANENVPKAPEPPGGAAGAQRAPPEAPLPEHPPQADVNEQGDRFQRLQGANHDDKLVAQQHVEAMPPEAKTKEIQRKFTAADEGDPHPSLRMTPQEQQLYDKWHKPLKEQERRLYQEVREKTPGKKSEIIEDDMNPDYAHRAVKGKTPAFDKFAMPDKEPTSGAEMGRGKLPQSTGSLQKRRYFAIEREDGERKVVHIGKDGNMHIVENGKHGEKPTLTTEHEDFVPGATVEFGGHKWEIKQAHTRELQEHSGHEYYETATANTLDNIVRLKNTLRAQAEFTRLTQSPEWEAWAMLDRGRGMNEKPPDGWRKPTGVPLFEDYYVHPKLAEAIEDFMKKGTNDIFTKVAQFSIRSLFWNPVPHMMNVGVHWSVARGWDWARPMQYVRLAQTMKEAAHEVLTQGPKFREMLREGSSMMTAPVETRHFYEGLMKSFGEHIEKEPGKYAPLMKALGITKVKDLVAAWYKASNRVMWQGSDILMMQRVLEMERKGMTLREAIHDTERHIPNYRVPTRILNSRVLKQALTDPRVVEFGRYRYGMINSFAHMAQDIAKGTAKQRFEAIGNIAVVGAWLGGIYPILDYLLQQATGNDKATMTRRGAATLAKDMIDFALQKDMATGDPRARKDIIGSLISPSPMAKEGVDQLVTGRDSFTGQEISPSESTPEQILQRAGHAVGNMVQPAQQVHRAIADAAATGDSVPISLGKSVINQTIGAKEPNPTQMKGQVAGQKMEKQAAKRRAKRPQNILEDLYKGLPSIMGGE